MKKHSTKSSENRAVVLLVGGLAMAREELGPLGRLLADQGWEVLAFDNLNVGKSPRGLTKENLSIEDQALHQWRRVDALTESTDRPLIIFGISMGGMIAATMAAQRPAAVAKLYLAATSANLPTNPAVSDQTYSEWVTADTKEKLEQAFLVAFGKTCLLSRPHIGLEYCRYRLAGENNQSPKDFILQLNSVRSFGGEKVYQALATSGLPLTIIVGEEDALFPTQHFVDIQTLLPKAHSIVLKNTGHMLHLENLLGLAQAIAAQAE